MYIKIKNAVKLIFMILIMFTLIISLIVSLDEHHIEICNEEKCIECAIINAAKNIVSISIAIIVFVIIGIKVYYHTLQLLNQVKMYEYTSLVSKKVQLNE